MRTTLLALGAAALIGCGRPEIERESALPRAAETYLKWPHTLKLGPSGRYELHEVDSSTGHRLLDGKAEFKETALLLTPNSSSHKPMELIHIPWGGRRYLVEAERMLDFCNDLNLNGELTEGYFLRCDGDPVPNVTGLPEVPPSWRGHLLSLPIVGEIVEPLDDGRARINLGQKDGLKVGMVLYVFGRNAEETMYYGDYRVRVHSVALDSAIVKGFVHPRNLKVIEPLRIASNEQTALRLQLREGK